MEFNSIKIKGIINLIKCLGYQQQFILQFQGGLNLLRF